MSKKQSNKSVFNPSTALQVYRGPAEMAVAKHGEECETIQFKYIGTLATTGGGVLASVIDAYSNVSSSPDWASAISMWQEMRILSLKFEAEPWNKFNTPTTTILAPVYTVEARDGSTALASLSDVSGYQSAEIHAPSTKITREIKMSGSGEAQFVPTSSGPASSDRFYIKFYSSGNTATTTVYDYMSTILVQFRGRK